MNPVTYTMLDLKGLDLASVRGQSYPGLYNSIYVAMNRCQEIILCNWFVAGILIPPTYCLLEIDEFDVISINNKVFIYPDDTIEIPTMGTTPVIEELNISENGTYEVPSDIDGYGPVNVNVFIPTPSLQEKSVIISSEQSEPYVVTPDIGYDGLSRVSISIIHPVAFIPIMTSNTTPSGIASASSILGPNFDAYKAFNGIEAESSMQQGWLASASDSSPYLKYEFQNPVKFGRLEIHTANNSTTTTRVFYVEGLKNGVWENCLKTGETLSMDFVRNTYGSASTVYNVSLNDEEYSAFRIRTNQPMYGGPGLYACTIGILQIYGNIIGGT